jgi:hypothetical protein
MSLQGGKGGYEKFVRDGFNMVNGGQTWALGGTRRVCLAYGSLPAKTGKNAARVAGGDLATRRADVLDRRVMLNPRLRAGVPPPQQPLKY